MDASELHYRVLRGDGSEMIALLSVIAPFLLPFVSDLIFGDNPASEPVKRAVVSIATEVLGTDNPDEALSKLNQDPELVKKLQEESFQVAIAAQVEETKRLAEVNATIRKEIESNDPWVRRARPFFMYVMAVTWGVQMLAVSLVILMYPERAGIILQGLSELTTMWMVALSVSGVYVWKRTQEKGVGGGPLDAIAGLIKKGK